MEVGRDSRETSERAIRDQLERIFASPMFARSERMKRFLEYVIDQSLKAKGGALKEYAIALAVYDKPDSFDPRIDPIVRVEASRLRAKLREYYDEMGPDDPLVISLRKKGYAPVIRKRTLRRIRGPRAPIPQQAGTSSAEARDLYLKGRHCWNKQTSRAIQEAIDCFNRAIALDSKFALAYGSLAECHASRAWLEEGAPGDIWGQADEAAGKALALDQFNSQALTARACKQAIFDWNWTASETLFRQVIAKNPEYATARQWYAIFCLAPQRRLNAALNEITRACELNPLSPVINTHLGWILYFRRQYQDAIDQYRRTIELDPGFNLAYWHMAFSLVQLRQFDEAVRAANDARNLDQSAILSAATLSFVYAGMGDRTRAEELWKELKTTSGSEYVSPVRSALICAALGDTDTAFQRLSSAQDGRAARLVHLKIEPALDKLKTDARFRKILSAMGLL
jgi:tetratricopeptide (TPR) repeat protein